MKRIGIIGGGRFGTALAECLARRGAEVLMLDRDRQVVQRLASLLTRVVQGDGTDAHVLEEAGFRECDSVVVAIGTNMESSILTTMNLKDLKVPRIVTKAGSDLHGKVLERVGADVVVHPDRERAQRLARSLLARSPVDYFEVAEGYSVLEIQAPPSFVGKSLLQSDVRKAYGVTVLAIRRAAGDGKITEIISPGGDEVVQNEDTLVLFGPDRKLDSIS
jgi:trk system potassium uptake protein TrkA